MDCPVCGGVMILKEEKEDGTNIYECVDCGKIVEIKPN